jgi:hypothetical protein
VSFVTYSVKICPSISTRKPASLGVSDTVWALNEVSESKSDEASESKSDEASESKSDEASERVVFMSDDG